MRRIIAICIVLCCLDSLAQKPWEPGVFPIACWRGPPPSHNTLKHYKTLRDCNFNVVGPTGGYTAETNRTLLDLCAKVGLKAIVTDGRVGPLMVLGDDWRERIFQVVSDYGDHPALYGYHLLDEPSSLLFGPLGKISREIERQAPAHLPYINLLPTYANTEQLGAPDYKDHLARFGRITKPRLFSYDHYALLKKGGIRPDYYENMELVRAESVRTGIPWWYVHNSGAYSGYRVPTAAEMRWQVFTSLAYGTKGISYWHYWGRKQENEERTGVVDLDGKPTRLYGILKELNRETQVLGDILLPTTCTEVLHVGTIPAGTRSLGKDTIVQLPSDKPLMVGLFQAKTGHQFAMIVNRDYANPVQFDASFPAHVVSVERISARDGSAAVLTLKERTLALNLPAGDGVLLRLTTNFDYPRPPKTLTTINFQFNTDDDMEGWDNLVDLSKEKVVNGSLTMTLGARDPHMQRVYLRVAAKTYRALRVRMRVMSGLPLAQVFWTTSDEPLFTATKHITFSIEPDGAWHEYEVPLVQHERWGGKEIRGIRLDPSVGKAEAGATVEIDWIVGVPMTPAP
ncbi:MAG: hypothetical protein KAI66_21590 [Lentisphaeria bacterium]|nr:hypothetical protein [Lentisphaeria bacterium]